MQKKISCSTCVHRTVVSVGFYWCKTVGCRKYSYEENHHDRIYGDSKELIIPAVNCNILNKCDAENGYEPNLITKIKQYFKGLIK